ncbi:MAG: hypothetical protein D6732_16055 [Methanobacteriota archaeon]|nr:MAG: hypothetical protein D6732_16055 [Euryarchaeota archaeon]
MELQPNTIEGLKWGLKNFDGIETDLRLTKDGRLAIHHDPILKSGEVVAQLTLQELMDKGIPSFEAFVSDEEVQRFAKNGKRFLFELKPNCEGKKAVCKDIAETLAKSFRSSLEETGFPTENITVISFQEDLLKPLVEEFNCAPLLPNLNECAVKEISGFTYVKLLGKFFSRRLPRILKNARKAGYSGVYTAREYFVGPLSRYHGSLKKKLSIAENLGLELGTNLGNAEIEPEYPQLLRVSDDLKKFPRYAKAGEKPIIAHRGTGTKGIKLDL